MKNSVAGFAAVFLLSPGGVLATDKAPNDAQIAAIVVTANQVDIDAGKLALTKASAAKVKDFAQLMITDHSGVNQAATELVSKLRVKPEPSSTSEGLEKGGAEKLAELQKLTGSSFDRAYVDNEVAYHQSVLDAVDQMLVPNARNAELKALLVKVRPAFVAHLQHAKQLQSSLRRNGE